MSTAEYGNPLQHSCEENSIQRSPVGYSLWSFKELDMTESACTRTHARTHARARAHTHTHSLSDVAVITVISSDNQRGPFPPKKARTPCTGQAPTRTAELEPELAFFCQGLPLTRVADGVKVKLSPVPGNSTLTVSTYNFHWLEFHPDS